MAITDIKIETITLYRSLGAEVSESDFPLPSFHNSGLYFLRLECTDGLVGFGEPSPYAANCTALIDALGSLEIRKFIGQPIDGMHDNALTKTSKLSVSQRAILSAISQAIFDVQSQSKKLPVWKLINNNANGLIRVYASGGMWYEDSDPSKVLEEAVKSKESGFYGYKFRPSTPRLSGDHFQRTLNPPKVNMPQTIELARKLRSELGDGFPLMLDFGCRLSVDETLLAIPELQEINLAMIEEPVARVAGDYARVKKSTSILLSGCESLSAIDEFREWVDCNAIDIVQPDTNLLNIFDLIKLEGRLSDGPVKSVLHNWTGGVSFFSNTHLAIAMNSCSLLEYSIIDNPLTNKLGYEISMPLNGFLDFRNIVGSGFKIDESRLVGNSQFVTTIAG